MTIGLDRLRRLVQQQRLDQRQSRGRTTACRATAAAGGQGHFQIGGAGHDHLALDLVVGQASPADWPTTATRRPAPSPRRSGAGRARDAARGRSARRPRDRMTGVGNRSGPVTRALEGIRGKRNLAPRVGAIETGPVDLRPADVQLAKTVQQRLPVVAARPQRRQPGVIALGKATPAHADQRRAGTDLQEDLAAPLGQGLHALGEPHGRARMAAPIARIGERMLVGQLGPSGWKRCRSPASNRWPRAAASLQGVQDRVHPLRMEGVRRGQRLRPDPLRLQSGQHFVDGRLIAGDDDALRPVQRGDGDAVAAGLDCRGDYALRWRRRRPCVRPAAATA